MLTFLLMILAIWLFGNFIVFIAKLGWGIFKVLMIVLGVLIWPVAFILLISAGLAAVALPVILICGIISLIGHIAS